MTFDLLIFAGKIKKTPSAQVFFLLGKQKALITKSRRTHLLHKISSKTLPSKRYITFALIATTQTFLGLSRMRDKHKNKKQSRQHNKEIIHSLRGVPHANENETS